MRLKQLAASRHTSVNRLLDELVTIALVQHDPARGLALPDKLDRHFSAP
ncbi:MAG: hypothetical protein Q8O52_26520 [Sulfuritalea sp.]|nr:hypothetical protein [Sulfuritalea sp.]